MRKEEEFRIYKPADIKITKRDIKGMEYHEILKRVEKIIFHQKDFQIVAGIKGFIFHGDVGLGKTALAKALAHDMGSTLLFVDGSDIARPLYGEAENQISMVFKKAKEFRHAIVLIDDCESVFPSRDWIKGESWHIAQNNVFFHELDNLDTSQTIVILTTNRYDLLDKAVKDRLQGIEFPKPSKEALYEIAEDKLKRLKIESMNGMKEAIEKGVFNSVRSLENYIMERYIDTIIKEKSSP